LAFVENEDLIWLARGFAEQLADGDWEAAHMWAQAAEAVSRGAFLVAERPPGECSAITRAGRYCQTPASLGELYCGLHARFVRQHVPLDQADA
jgi:hypothetical protein